MKKTWKKVLGIVLLSLILGASIGLSFYSYNARVVNREIVPMPFGIGVSVVYSGSMEPEFSTGDLVIITRANDYVVSDVVIYQSDDKAIMHRIVAIDGDIVTMRGDSNNANDEPVTKDCIKGKVLFAIPLVGFVFSFIKTVPGTILVLGLAFFLFEYSFIREKKEQHREQERLRQELETLKGEQNQQ